MTRDEVVRIVNEFLIDEIEIDKELINENAHLRDDLKIDSLDFVDIVVVVEQHFGFTIKAEELKDVTTLSQFYDYIFSKVANQ